MSSSMADETDRVAMLSDLHALEARLEARFDARLDARLKDTLAEVRTMIAADGATTRRHFDIMVERMSDLMKRIGEGVGHHSRVLDDHESRLQQLEKFRRFRTGARATRCYQPSGHSPPE